MKDGNILEKIVAVKREEVARLNAQPRALGCENLLWATKAFGARRDFADALRYPRRGKIALIAEVKKASPSAGVIRADFDPVRIAKDYEAAGASCLSVLTDERFFQGSLKFLQQIRDAVRLPILRKDFIIDERQILESVAIGADAVLLIVAALKPKQLRALHDCATANKLSALIEVHTLEEIGIAVEAGAKIIGINNRNL
ncbi:MAG TPA: indole-3-glycerol phosphate synthase TrpC, partial [Verrucomicrobiae bacterium]